MVHHDYISKVTARTPFSKPLRVHNTGRTVSGLYARDRGGGGAGALHRQETENRISKYNNISFYEDRFIFSKQYIPRLNAALCCITSGPSLFAKERI